MKEGAGLGLGWLARGHQAGLGTGHIYPASEVDQLAFQELIDVFRSRGTSNKQSGLNIDLV